MKTILHYYKLGSTWYLDLPDYLDKPGSHEEDLERIGSFHDFLELASNGMQDIKFELAQHPFEGADVVSAACPDEGSILLQCSS